MTAEPLWVWAVCYGVWYITGLVTIFGAIFLIDEDITLSDVYGALVLATLGPVLVIAAVVSRLWQRFPPSTVIWRRRRNMKDQGEK